MTLLNLRDAKRIWVGQNEAARSLWLGANRWDKPTEAAFDPLSLFAGGGPGQYFTFDDLSKLSQADWWYEAVTAIGQPIGYIESMVNGVILRHQSWAGPKAILGGDGLGRYWLECPVGATQQSLYQDDYAQPMIASMFMCEAWNTGTAWNSEPYGKNHASWDKENRVEGASGRLTAYSWLNVSGAMQTPVASVALNTDYVVSLWSRNSDGNAEARLNGATGVFPLVAVSQGAGYTDGTSYKCSIRVVAGRKHYGQISLHRHPTPVELDNIERHMAAKASVTLDRDLTPVNRVTAAFDKLTGPWAYFLADDMRGGAAPWTWRRNPAAVAAGFAERTLTPTGTPVVNVDDRLAGGLTTVGSFATPAAGCWYGNAVGGFFPSTFAFSYWGLFTAGNARTDFYIGPLADAEVTNRVRVEQSLSNIVLRTGNRGSINSPRPSFTELSSIAISSPTLLNTDITIAINNIIGSITVSRARSHTNNGDYMVLGGATTGVNTATSPPNINNTLTPTAIWAISLGQVASVDDLAALEALRVSLLP